MNAAVGLAAMTKPIGQEDLIPMIADRETGTYFSLLRLECALLSSDTRVQTFA